MVRRRRLVVVGARRRRGRRGQDEGQSERGAAHPVTIPPSRKLLLFVASANVGATMPRLRLAVAVIALVALAAAPAVARNPEQPVNPKTAGYHAWLRSRSPDANTASRS